MSIATINKCSARSKIASLSLLLCLVGCAATASNRIDSSWSRQLKTSTTGLQCFAECSATSDCEQDREKSLCSRCRDDGHGVHRCFASSLDGPGVLPSDLPIKFPEAKGTVVSEKVIEIPKNKTFDGGMKRYQLNQPCHGQKESGREEAVFYVREGATLKNVIIGKDQTQGVMCRGDCVIENVWWEDVCEDALTSNWKGGPIPTTVIVRGGGARYAEDKVVQHNGKGIVKISNFFVHDFGKLYRSCGNCDTGQWTRQVEMEDITAVHGYMLAGINVVPYGDTATFKNIKMDRVDVGCGHYRGTDVGRSVNDHPTLLSVGFDNKFCKMLK